MKPLGLPLGSNRQFWRVACIACIPFVFTFIAFNLLDLDGTNLTKAFNRTITDADIETAPQIDPVPDRVENFKPDHTLILDDTPDAARYHQLERPTQTRLENARSHRYHVSLPRDSVPG